MMQNFSELVKQAKYINTLNKELQCVLPAQLKDMKLVKIEEGSALLLADNAAILQFAQSMDMLKYLTIVAPEITSVEFEVRRS